MAADASPYFHVVATIADEEKRLIFADLTSSEIRSKFVRPYKKGARILLGGEVLDLSLVRELRIVRTPLPKDEALKKLQRDSRADIDHTNSDPNSGVVLISFGSGWEDREIADIGDDVTAEFVWGPPGTAPWWKPVIEHPYVSGLVITIVAALILAWVFGIGK